MRNRLLSLGGIVIVVIALTGCSGDDTNVNNNLSPGNNLSAPDVDADDDARDTDVAEPDDIEEGDDTDVENIPSTRTCPEEAGDSCVADILSCVGDATTEAHCVYFGEPGSVGYREEVQFTNQAKVHYRTVMVDDEEREFRTVYGSDGERCYNAAAQEQGDEPSSWSVSEPQFGSFVLNYGDELIDIECSGVDDDEQCSVGLITNSFPLFWDRPDDCEPHSQDDICVHDDDEICDDDQGCCRPAGAEIRQCMSLEYCMTQREPVDCETNADCSSGETCLRCNRDADGGEPQRECIPDEIASDPNNQIGCVADDCISGAGDCAEDRTCCKSAGLYQCLPPMECAEAPDPNPVCDPASSQVCPSGSQNCCFDDMTNEFRCLFNAPSCQTNVCFGGADCASDQECCGHDPDDGSPGSCVSSCEPPDNSCSEENDCFGEEVCCKMPGYDTGICEINEMSCEHPTCTTDSNCLDGWICCDESPLTEGICVEGADSCPPPAP